MAATTTTMTTVTMNEVETRGTAPELTSEGTLNGKVTPGEELFLVHLTRQAGDDEDEDAAVAVEQPGRKRATSIGEELWSVHLKRDAQSMSEEDDGDDVEDVINDKDKADENDKAMGTGDVNSGDTDSEEPPTKRQAVVPQDKDTKVDD